METISFHDYVNDPGCQHAPYTVDHRWFAGTGASATVVADNPAGHYPDPACDDYVVQVCDAGHARLRVDVGAGRYDFLGTPGSVVVAPPGVAGDYEIDGSFDCVVIALPKALVEEIWEGCGLGGARESLFTGVVRDPLVANLMKALAYEEQVEGPLGAMLSDQSVRMLAAQLASVANEMDVSERPLDAVQLARVRAVMDECVRFAGDEPPVLADFARVLDMSPTRFMRAFRAATGHDPVAELSRRHGVGTLKSRAKRPVDAIRHGGSGTEQEQQA